MTLVCTDVEGSTELWEWDHKAMMDAISMHDRVMRMHLSKFGGYEVATEGDAFVIAFHTPGKAVAWAAATQQVTHCADQNISLIRTPALATSSLLHAQRYSALQAPIRTHCFCPRTAL